MAGDVESVMRAQLAYTAELIEQTLPYMDSDDGIDYLWAALRLSEEMVGAWRDGRTEPLAERMAEYAQDAAFPGTLPGEPPLSELEASYASDGYALELLDWVTERRKEAGREHD